MADDDQEADALNLEPEEDDFMEEDGDLDVDTPPLAPPPKILPAIAGGSAPRMIKGRGFKKEAGSESHSDLSGWDSDSINTGELGRSPVKSIEGWIIMVTGVHEEAEEDDLKNEFGAFGVIKELHLHLDKRTGFMKGYALILYENFEEAQAAIEQMNGKELLTKTINVDWAIINGPIKKCKNKAAIRDRGHRSRSPRRRY